MSKNNTNNTNNNRNNDINIGKETNSSSDVNALIIEEAVKQFKNGKIKSAEDVSTFIKDLYQPIMQRLLDAELDVHLNYSKYEHTKNITGTKTNNNARNGHCKPKTVKTTYGNIEVKTPRDRNATFEPIIIEKGQTNMFGFEYKCISLYAKGMSVRDIEATLKDIYGVKINKDQITTLISAVNEEVTKWRNRLLKPLYVFAYADCLYIPIKDDLKSDKRAVYIIIGVDMNGMKDVLGMWIDNTESATFWTNVFLDLKNRGVQDILFMSSDGIAGFKGSLETVFPKTQTQRCVVHLDRNLFALCPKKQAKKMLASLKKIYTASNLDAANIQLDAFVEEFKDYENVVKKASEFMVYLEPLFELPQEIRKCIYTSNAVESVNSALRKVTRGKGSFPSEASVFKVLFLRIRDLTAKWSKPIPNWITIQKQLQELFGDRYTKYLDV